MEVITNTPVIAIATKVTGPETCPLNSVIVKLPVRV